MSFALFDTSNCLLFARRYPVMLGTILYAKLRLSSQPQCQSITVALLCYKHWSLGAPNANIQIDDVGGRKQLLITDVFLQTPLTSCALQYCTALDPRSVSSR